MELQSQPPPNPGKMRLVPTTKPLWRYVLLGYLRLGCLRSGPPGLRQPGCVIDGGSLAGKLSASARSSSICGFPLRFSRSRFSYFLVLVITFAVAVMVLLFRGAGPIGTSAVVTCSIAVTGWRVWLLVLDTCHSARMRAGGKTTSTKVPSCSLLLIVREA
jgi:hypothetical protein